MNTSGSLVVDVYTFKVAQHNDGRKLTKWLQVLAHSHLGRVFLFYLV